MPTTTQPQPANAPCPFAPDFDPDSAEPIPNPTTEAERAFNQALANYRAARAEQASMRQVAAKLAVFAEEMKDPTKRAQFHGSLNQLARGHVSETERREHAWLTKKVAEAKSTEQMDKAMAKLANWRKAHAAAAVILERGA